MVDLYERTPKVKKKFRIEILVDIFDKFVGKNSSFDTEYNGNYWDPKKVVVVQKVVVGQRLLRYFVEVLTWLEIQDGCC